MIVCDCCRNVTKPTSQCYGAILKEEEKKGRLTTRTVKRIPIHLCEDCITRTIGVVAAALGGLHNSKP